MKLAYETIYLAVWLLDLRLEWTADEFELPTINRSV
jgi:hypothetical protein